LLPPFEHNTPVISAAVCWHCAPMFWPSVGERCSSNCYFRFFVTRFVPTTFTVILVYRRRTLEISSFWFHILA